VSFDKIILAFVGVAMKSPTDHLPWQKSALESGSLKYQQPLIRP